MTLTTEHPLAASEKEAPARATGDLLVGLIPHTGRVRILNGDVIVASTDRAVELHEVDVPVRIYIPREDVVLDELRPIENVTFCPFKGVASDYWALAGDGDVTPVAWSYPEPISAFAGIAGHVAFYDTLTVEESA